MRNSGSCVRYAGSGASFSLFDLRTCVRSIVRIVESLNVITRSMTAPLTVTSSCHRTFSLNRDVTSISFISFRILLATGFPYQLQLCFLCVECAKNVYLCSCTKILVSTFQFLTVFFILNASTRVKYCLLY